MGVTSARPRSAAALRRAHDSLLFTCAYPVTAAAWDDADAALRHLAGQAQALVAGPRGAGLRNSGIAGTPIVAAFSLGLTEWLVARFGDAVTLDSVEGDPLHVMAVLGSALDPIEQERLSEQPLSWRAWQSRHLGTPGPHRLRRLLQLVQRLVGSPAQRDALFASLRLFVRWQIATSAPVLTTGRFGAAPLALHPQGLARRTLPEVAWRQGRPRRARLSSGEQGALIDLARATLASTLSETDPFTSAHQPEVELHDLGRGIQIGLFAMEPARKLALEAYVGYLLLKNRVPVAYGGGWVLGRQARFGLNVLPPFRGGESSVILGQLLRLYGWRFGLKRFLIEPFQIGRGNPDGIASGAFWFYWRLGFRPLQKDLLQMATVESRRVEQTGARTPPALLRRLAGSVLAWEAPARGKWPGIDIEQIGEQVTRHILDRFDGDRTAARRAAKRALGISDDGLAVLLAAIAPRGGWSRGDLAGLRTIMARKDRSELDQVVSLQQHRGLMRALAAASAAS